MAPRGRLTEQAYDTIKQKLLDGQYKMGERLSVENLVIELNVSRQPVMDALKRLATERYVEIVPQVGVKVVAPQRREILDFFRLFAAAEGLCAELAAERADDKGAAQLALINEEVGLLLRPDLDDALRSRRYRVLNREFHGTLHALAASPTLVDAVSSVWDRSDFYISTTLGTHLFSERLRDAFNEHEAICQTIANRDAAGARRAMENHVLAFGEVAGRE